MLPPPTLPTRYFLLHRKYRNRKYQVGWRYFRYLLAHVLINSIIPTEYFLVGCQLLFQTVSNDQGWFTVSTWNKIWDFHHHHLNSNNQMSQSLFLGYFMNIENKHEQLRILPDKKAKFDTRRNPKQRAISNLDQCAFFYWLTMQCAVVQSVSRRSRRCRRRKRIGPSLNLRRGELRGEEIVEFIFACCGDIFVYCADIFAYCGDIFAYCGYIMMIGNISHIAVVSWRSFAYRGVIMMIGERETNVEKLFGKAGEGNFLKPIFVKQVKLLNKHTHSYSGDL